MFCFRLVIFAFYRSVREHYVLSRLLKPALFENESLLRSDTYRVPDFSCYKGILAKMKEGAENVQTKVQAKLESVVKNVGETGKGKVATCL